MQNLTYGVDVSHYQSAIDWKQAWAMGKRFCVAKASDGLGDNGDSMFAAHRAGAKAAGLVFGAYHFFRFDIDPIKQAETFLRVTGGVMPGELPLCVDVEWDNRSKNQGYHDGGQIDEDGAAKALECLSYLESKTGMKPIIYTSNGFFTGLKKPEAFARFIPWIASYTSFEKIRTPKPWSKPVFWQYSDDEKISGVEAIDGDAFLGTFEELQKLTNKANTMKPEFDFSEPNVKMVQIAMNAVGVYPKLDVDGVFGPKTRAALIEVAKNG